MFDKLVIEHIPDPIDVKENNHFNRTRILKNERLIPYLEAL